MKGKRYTEEQILRILREVQSAHSIQLPVNTLSL